MVPSGGGAVEVGGGAVVSGGVVVGAFGVMPGELGDVLGVVAGAFGVTVVVPGSVVPAVGVLLVAFGLLVVALGVCVWAPGVLLCGGTAVRGAVLCVALGLCDPAVLPRPAAPVDWATAKAPPSSSIPAGRMNFRVIVSPSSSYPFRVEMAAPICDGGRACGDVCRSAESAARVQLTSMRAGRLLVEQGLVNLL